MELRESLGIVEYAARLKANLYGYSCSITPHRYTKRKEGDYSFCFLRDNDIIGFTLRSVTLSEIDIIKMAKSEARLKKFLKKIDKILSPNAVMLENGSQKKHVL